MVQFLVIQTGILAHQSKDLRVVAVKGIPDLCRRES